MLQPPLRFEHQVIDAAPPGGGHDVTLLTDLTGNGLPDLIIGGKHGESALFWYENPGWTRHHLGEASSLEPCGALLDLTGNGRPDLIVGQGQGGRELYWFECPADPRQPWPRHLLEDRFEQYHDQVVGDLDGDGQPELAILSQGAGLLGYYDVPPDPAAGPWHDSFHVLADDTGDQEGLALGDLQQTGRLSLLAGTSLYHPCRCAPGTSGAVFHREPVAPGLQRTRAACGDLTGSGWLDLVLCEGEADRGRLLWFAAPRWRPHLLAEDLDHPHSLQLADFTGSGRLDIMVAEMGLAGTHPPRLIVYRNLGGGEFEPTVLCTGLATHEAKVADLTGNGRPDIVGKAYQERHVDLWLNLGPGECDR